MFRLEFETGNAAFDVAPEHEIAAILWRLSNGIREGETRLPGPDAGTVRDSNGDTIGKWQFTPED